MKPFLKLLSLLIALLVAGHASAAAPDIAGVWRGKLQVDPKTAMTIQFTFAKKPDGSYSAVLDSPDNPSIKNVPANTVSLTDSALKLTVASLSGSYSGTVKGGTIEGQWTQPGGTLPLVLSPHQKAVLSKAERDQIVGAWNGPFTMPGGSLTFVLRFKEGAQGDLQGTLAVPEQGGNEFPMSEIELGNGKLSFRIPQIRGEFRADYANESITGFWKQPGMPPEGNKVVLKRGEVGAKKYVLKLSGDSFAKVSGGWKGTLTVKNPQRADVALPLVVRFFTDERAEMMGAIDSPSQKAMNIPITEASLTGDQLILKIAAIGAEYRGTLAGQKITGQWTQGPQSFPLTLTR